MKIKIYSKDPCPYCDLAKNMMNDLGLPYEEIDLTGNQAEIDRIKAETGWRTVPIIFVDDTLVGGYVDLKAFLEEKKLK